MTVEEQTKTLEGAIGGVWRGTNANFHYVGSTRVAGVARGDWKRFVETPRNWISYQGLFFQRFSTTPRDFYFAKKGFDFGIPFFKLPIHSFSSALFTLASFSPPLSTYQMEEGDDDDSLRLGENETSCFLTV